MNFRRLTSCFVIISLCLSVLCGCSRDSTAELKYRKAATLHADKTEHTLEKLELSGAQDLQICAAQAFVYDKNAQKYIFLRGADKILYPASTTKLLTALYIQELLSPETLVTPGDEQELKNEQSTIAFVRSNHTLTVEMLIEAMLLPSGGDAAYALAAAGGRVLSEDKDISGKEAALLFIDGMNEYALRMGLCGSKFTSPDGFFDVEHYSTLEDMTLVALAATENELIMKYTSLPSDNVVYASGHSNTWRNTNRLIHEGDKYYSPYVTGLKTGTLDGNSCLMASFVIDGREFVAGVFSETEEELRYVDMTSIINFCEELYN